MSKRDRKNRVLHFGISSNQGGIETYLLKISKSISKDKFSFSFIDSTGAAPAFQHELSDTGATFYKVTPRRKNYLKNKHDIAALFRDNDFDVLHFHVNTLSYIEPIFAALDNDVRVIIHSRNAGARGSKVTQVMHSINKYRVNRLKGDVKKIAVSRLAGEWLYGNKSDFEVYNNGVDLARFRFDAVARKNVRNEVGVGEEEHVLGCVAAFSPAKNQQFAVEILKFLNGRKELGGIKLLFVGDGSLRPKVQDLVDSYHLNDHVKFLGKRSDIPELMSAMDVLLLPSFFEGFPNVVLEAQACGLPCLISDKITDEVVLDNGLVKQFPIDESFVPVWAEELKRCMQFPITLEHRFAACQRVEAAGFSTESEIKKIEELYEKLMSS